MAQDKKLFSDLFQDTKLEKRLADPDDRKIVEDTLTHLFELRALKPMRPLTPGDIAYFVSDFEYASLYYLCGLMTREEVNSYENFFDADIEKRFPKKVLDAVYDLQEAFEIKSIELNAIEADMTGDELAEADYFDMEKEAVKGQVPYDFMSDYTKMRNYQLVLNYFSKIDVGEHFVDANVYLSDALSGTLMNAINALRHLTHSFDNDEIVSRVLAMCELFESVACYEDNYGAMTPEMIKSNLKDVDVHLRNGILHICKGDEVKKTKYLQLLDLLTKPKKDIEFLDIEKRQKEDEKDREAFLQKIWGKEPPSQQTLNEIDFAVGEEILQTMASNIGKTHEDIEPDDVLIYLTDTNAANLYYTCGFLSEQEYKVFYRVMTDLEQAYDSGIEKERLKDFKLPELLDKACEMNPNISSNDRRRIRACYENFCHVVEYFKDACEVKLLAEGITDGENDKYNLTNPKGIFASSKPFANNNFVRVYHIAKMLNASDCAAHGEAFDKSRLLLTYLSDYYFHDALKKMRVEGERAEAAGTQTSVRVMNDYLFGITQKCTLSDKRVAHMADLLVGHTRKALGMTLKNAQTQTALARFDAVMGAETISRIVEDSWKRMGILNPALATSYRQER